MRYMQGLLVRKEGRKGAVDDLGNGQMVEVSLSPDRLNLGLLDMEGGALGLSVGISGVCQSGLTGGAFEFFAL